MQSSMPVQPPIYFKNPTVATFLSLVTGLGQLYNGQIFKGIFFFGIMFIAVLLMTPPIFIGWILAPIIWVLNLVDANSSAKRINKRLVARATPMDVTL